jgi:CubicO group peptidase (beta-lactamase class C family)
LLKQETWTQALTPHKTRDGITNHYGLGWSLYFNQPRSLYGYGHDGSWGGFRTSYYRYLAEDRSTVILSNRGNLDTDKLWEAVNEVVNTSVPEK